MDICRGKPWFDSGKPKMTALYFLSGECQATEVEGRDLATGLAGTEEVAGGGETSELTLGIFVEEGTNLRSELSSDLRGDSSYVRDETADFKAVISFF